MNGPKLVRQFVSFGGVGALATLIHILIALTASERFGWGAFQSNGLAAMIAFFVSYFGNEFLTFERERSRFASISRYLAIAFAGFLVTSAIMITVQSYGFSPLIYIFLVLLIVPPLSFLFAKYWAFGEKA